MEKTQMKYRVLIGKHPATGAPIARPLIVGAQQCGMSQLVDNALKLGYVRGGKQDLVGIMNGMMDAIKDTVLGGKTVSLKSWLRFAPVLTGTVGENRQLSAKNEVKLAITALSQLKVGADEFSWQNVDDVAAFPKITEIVSPNGNSGEIIKGQDIIVAGKNLAYDSALGDLVTVEWTTDGDEGHIVNIAPKEAGETQLRFGWPEALASVPAGTEVVITLRTCQGAEGGAVYTASKSAKVVAAAA